MDDRALEALSDTLYDALYAITPFAEQHFADEREGLRNAVRAVLKQAAVLPATTNHDTDTSASHRCADCGGGFIPGSDVELTHNCDNHRRPNRRPTVTPPMTGVSGMQPRCTRLCGRTVGMGNAPSAWCGRWTSSLTR
ncbi:hypothetical protein STENM36S_05048 [Streptomyces tendae]